MLNQVQHGNIPPRLPCAQPFQPGLEVTDDGDEAPGDEKDRKNDQSPVNDESKLPEAAEILREESQDEGPENRAVERTEASDHSHDEDRYHGVKAHEIRGQDEDVMGVKGAGDP